MRLLFVLFCVIISPDVLPAQQADSLKVLATNTDSLPPKKVFWAKRFITKDYPNPRKAALMSLLIPGSGQAYNKSWWKVPMVYAALGTAGYFALDNGKQYRALRDNYKWSVDQDPDTNPTELPYTQMSADNLRENRDIWRRYTEWSYLALGFIWLLGSADTFVDGHLKHFDVSEDLSLRLKPDTKSVSGLGMSFGAKVVLQW